MSPLPADGYAGDLSPQEALDLLAEDPQAVLVDVRTRAEWTFVGVPDLSPVGKEPVLLAWVTSAGPNPDFLPRLLELDPQGPLVFLCRSGHRSVTAASPAGVPRGCPGCSPELCSPERCSPEQCSPRWPAHLTAPEPPYFFFAFALALILAVALLTAVPSW